MKSFPIFFKIEHQKCLVVGTAEPAERKSRALQKAGAIVERIAAQDFTPHMVQKYKLVIADGENGEIDTAVYEAAMAANIPVNVVDKPHLCSFITPAIVDRDPLMIAISSNGRAPVLARLVRAKIETVIPAGYGKLAQLASRFREKSKEILPDFQQRRLFWEKAFSGMIAEHVFRGEDEKAEAVLNNALHHAHDDHINMGEVYLIGAGPGDPDLMTFKGLRYLQQADTVVYDRLVSDDVLALARRDATKIYVGKQRANHCMKQEDINMLLVERAQQGERVARLKGGDPFVFGRGGEEMDALIQHDIPFSIIPGISSALGCAAYAGIPLTHRDHAQSCVFVTGHLKDGSLSLPWEKLADPTQTIVVFMGKVTAPILQEKLIAHGLSPQTPFALIVDGTRATQAVYRDVLENLGHTMLKQEKGKAHLLIIGRVCDERI